MPAALPTALPAACLCHCLSHSGCIAVALNGVAIGTPIGMPIGPGLREASFRRLEVMMSAKILPGESLFPAQMSNDDLCDYISSRAKSGREALIALKPWLAEAQKRFSQPGRRVPVPGRPSFGEWIRENTGYSDRYIRMILSDAGPKKRLPKARAGQSAIQKRLARAAVELAQLEVQGHHVDALAYAKEVLRAADEANFPGSL